MELFSITSRTNIEILHASCNKVLIPRYTSLKILNTDRNAGCNVQFLSQLLDISQFSPPSSSELIIPSFLSPPDLCVFTFILVLIRFGLLCIISLLPFVCLSFCFSLLVDFLGFVSFLIIVLVFVESLQRPQVDEYF